MLPQHGGDLGRHAAAARELGHGPEDDGALRFWFGFSGRVSHQAVAASTRIQPYIALHAITFLPR